MYAPLCESQSIVHQPRAFNLPMAAAMTGIGQTYSLLFNRDHTIIKRRAFFAAFSNGPSRMVPRIPYPQNR